MWVGTIQAKAKENSTVAVKFEKRIDKVETNIGQIASDVSYMRGLMEAQQTQSPKPQENP